MKVSEIVSFFEKMAPLFHQESYDNSGLQIGNLNTEITSVTLCLDVTHDIVDECIENGSNVIVSHHPMIFKGLKNINLGKESGLLIEKIIKNDISVYSIHTNIDNQINGINGMICNMLNIVNLKPLQPAQQGFVKIATFVPVDYANNVRQAFFDAGGGHIGNYDSCSFNISGNGTFRALDGSNPFVGSVGEIHNADEIRVETIVPVFMQNAVIEAIKKSHPYEEVAYDIFPLLNTSDNVGAGVIGVLEQKENLFEFLKNVKQKFNLNVLRHNAVKDKKIEKVAVCSGSGAFLINQASKLKADLYLTGDLKYHDFFSNDSSLTIADIGHFESEQIFCELIFNALKEKFPNFAVQIAKSVSNPVKYL